MSHTPTERASLPILTCNYPHGGTVTNYGSDDHQAEHEVVQGGDEHVHGGVGDDFSLPQCNCSLSRPL